MDFAGVFTPRWTHKTWEITNPTGLHEFQRYCDVFEVTDVHDARNEQFKGIVLALLHCNWADKNDYCIIFHAGIFATSLLFSCKLSHAVHISAATAQLKVTCLSEIFMSSDNMNNNNHKENRISALKCQPEVTAATGTGRKWAPDKRRRKTDHFHRFHTSRRLSSRYLAQGGHVTDWWTSLSAGSR